MYRLFAIISVLILSTDFFGLSLTTYENKTVLAEKLKGSYVAVATIDSKAPDIAFLRFLDSLQNARVDLQVIVQPSLDAATGISTTDLSKTLLKDIKSSMILLKPSTTKVTAADRSELVKWLMSVELNGHFQLDAITANSLFIISKDGELKSVFAAGFPVKSLVDALQ